MKRAQLNTSPVDRSSNSAPASLLSLSTLSDSLASKELSARALVESCLDRISDGSGQGAQAFLSVSATAARVRADAIDQERQSGMGLPPFAGIPVSVKDLFDVAGEVTTAGSRVLRGAAPATSDAPAVARLRRGGFILMGRTNMTEFAFSGLGINPHYGTPLNPFDRATGRIPGGSSSGAAIAVTDRMVAASLATDTGGSCRIPAALSGVVGFKPTARRIPRRGVIPLSSTLDSIGSIAPTVACCAAIDSVLVGARQHQLPPVRLNGLRLLLPTTLVMEGLDHHVSADLDRSLTALSQAGVGIETVTLPALANIPRLNAGGGFAAAEAFAWHRELLSKHAIEYDPRIVLRILKGREQSAADYVQLLNERADLSRSIGKTTGEFDAVIMPTVPLIAPSLKSLQADDEYFRINSLMLRNPSLANFLDRCAISIPMHRPGEPPTGLTLMGEHGEDRKLLTIAQAIERIVTPGEHQSLRADS